MSQPLDINITEDDCLLLSLRDRQLRTLFETTLDAIAITDDQGRYLDVNPAACELFGLTRDELLGRYISEFATPGFDFLAEWQEFQEQEKVRGEFQLVRADGEMRVVEYAATSNFLPHRHLSVMRDITEQHLALQERKQAEAKIQELTAQLEAQSLKSGGDTEGMTREITNTSPISHISNISNISNINDRRETKSLLEKIVSHVPGIIYQFRQRPDGTFHFPYANQGMKAIYGFSPEEVREDASQIFSLIHPEDLARVSQSIFESAASLTPWYCEYRICFPDGRLLWLLGHATPQREADGGTIWDGYIQDISKQQAALQERKQAELENWQVQNFLNSIIENIPTMIFVKDVENLQFVRFNKAGEELLGYPREALLGKNDCDFFPPEQADFFMAKDREVLVSGHILDIPEENVQTNHQGIRTLHTRKVPILDEFGHPQYLLGICEDITESKQNEAKIIEITQLQQAILDGANYTIISTDTEGIIKTINAAAQRALGYSAAEVVDKFTPAIFHDLEEIKQRAAELTKELGKEILPGFEVFTAKAQLGRIDEYEWSYIRRDGSRFPVQISITALRNEEGILTGFLGIGNDITEQQTALRERKLAEAALAESEAQNQAMLQAIPDIMFRLNKAGIYLEYTTSTEFFDLSNPQAVGKSMAEDLSPEHYQRHMHNLAMALETGQIQIYEQEVTIAGQTQYEEVRVVPLDNREEVLFMIRDIGDRKHAETQLKEISERLSLSLKSGGIGSWEWDIVQNSLLWDDRMYELYGVNPETNNCLAFDVWVNGLHPDDREASHTLIQQAIAGEAEFNPEFRVVHPDDSIHFLKAFGIVQHDPDGRPQKMIGVNFDITDRKRQEQSLRLIVEGTAAKTGEEFFKSCVQYLAQVLEVRYALIAEFVDADKSVATTLAFWADNDFGDNFSYHLLGSPSENIQNEFCLYPNSVQLLFPEDTDLVTLQVKSYAGLPIIDAEGNSLGLLVVMDTKPMIQNIETQSAILKIFATRAGAEMERIQAEAAVRRSEIQLRQQSTELETTLKKLQSTQTQLIQAEKMSGLGQLVAGIAHEINNPVSFILGNLQPAGDYASQFTELIHLYQEHYPSPPPVISNFLEAMDVEYLIQDFADLLKSIKTGATRIQDIVKSLRTFSRLDESGLKAIDIHENLDSTLAVLQNRLHSRAGNSEINIIKNYDDLPLVEAYGGLLNQVFMNLLVNAIDAIEQQQDSLDPADRLHYFRMITITTSLSAKNQVLISIRDNGCGMSSEIEDQIFNPFFTTKPVGKGTGMGLATSYQVIEEQHQGRITVNSIPGQGTDFMIILPIKQVINSAAN